MNLSKKYIIVLLSLLPYFGYAQQLFYQDIFYGGTTGAGFSTANGSGVGNFNIFIEPGSTIKKAWLFALRFGESYPVTISLNSINYSFNNSNLITEYPSFLTYCSKIGVHAINITNNINPSTIGYNITIPQQ